SEPGSNSSLEDFELQTKRAIKNGPSLDKIWSLGLWHPKDASTRVPTQITCRIFKKRSHR
ncbi:MAG: hypothetical protein ACO3FH_08215, partial [Steroidobacteraceae bacterium]